MLDPSATLGQRSRRLPRLQPGTACVLKAHARRYPQPFPGSESASLPPLAVILECYA